MIELQNGPEESTINDLKRYTGVIPYKVLAINPTKDQLHDLGLKFIKSEPVYQREFDNDGEVRKSTLIDVWLKSQPTPQYPDIDTVVKLTFFINNDPFVSVSTGKSQYVNKYGRTAWAKDPSGLNGNPYFINEDARPAYRGEEDLYKFLFAWLNMTYDLERKIFNPCRVDVTKIFNGDYTELQNIVNVANAYTVKVLTGVRKAEGDDGTVRYYPTTYNKYFLKHNQKSTDSIEKFIKKDEYNAFKDAAYYTLQVKEFDPADVPDEEPSNTPSMSVGGNDPF